jgi:3'-phosphoadenosine 5'-phosphosulfate sulfotransferase (PAPS reductase)/FAD synthetase
MELTHILTHLIALTQRARAGAEERGIKEMYSHEAWVKEWSTVRVGSARQSGHSTAVAQATKLFEMPLVIVPYQLQVGNIERLDGYSNVVSAFTFLKHPFRGREIDAIFVDCASHMQELYRTKEEYARFWDEVYATLQRMSGLLILVA